MEVYSLGQTTSPRYPAVDVTSNITFSSIPPAISVAPVSSSYLSDLPLTNIKYDTLSPLSEPDVRQTFLFPEGREGTQLPSTSAASSAPKAGIVVGRIVAAMVIALMMAMVVVMMMMSMMLMSIQ